MIALHTEGGTRSPSILFNPETGYFVMEGRSIPENAQDLYAPVLAWLRNYIKQPAQETHLEFKLSYFNSSSTEHLLEMFNILKTVNGQGRQFTARWYREADDEDMEQIAQDFMALIGMQFQIKVVPPADELEAS